MNMLTSDTSSMLPMSSMELGQFLPNQEQPRESKPFGYPDEDQTIREMEGRLKAAQRHSVDWREESIELYDYEAGKQWTAEDEARMKEQSRPMVTFNVMQKFIDAVCGLQINNRQEIKCYPRLVGKVGISDLATSAVEWTRNRSHIDIEESDAAHDLLLTGMGWMEHYYSDESYSYLNQSQKGYIGGERRDPIEMYWDPSARRKNLIDRRWQIRIKRMTPDEYYDKFGEYFSGSIDVPGVGSEDQGNLQRIIKPQDYNSTDTGSGATQRGKINVVDYQWCCTHHYVTVQANFYGQTGVQQFSLDEWREIEPKLKKAAVPYQSKREKRLAYYRAWIAADGVKGGIKELAHGFTFQCVTGKRERNSNLWYGLGRGIKDPQKWVNKFFSSILWQLSVNPKGGLLAEDDAFENIDEAEDTWADPSAITIVKKGAITNGKIQPKPAGTFPQGMSEMMQFSMNALPQTSGVNAELLGMTERTQPGVVEYQRKQGAMAIIAWFFDGLRRYYQEAGELTLCMVRDFISDGRLIRIAGQDGAQYVPLFRDPLTQEFDIIVDEAPTSVNMQERVFAVLQQVIPQLIQAGIKIPVEVMDYIPLPQALIEKWKEQLTPSPQEQQMQQQQQQTMQRAADASIAKDETSAQLNVAKAQETMVKAQIVAPAEAMRKAAEAGNIQAGAYG